MNIPAHVRDQALPAFVEAVSTLSPVLRKYPRTRRLLQTVATAQTVCAAATALRSRFRPPAPEKTTWTVTINEDDDLYEHALGLLRDHTEQNWQSVEAVMVYSYDDDEGNDVYDVKFKPNTRAEHRFTLDGHSIFAYVDSFTPPAHIKSAAELAKVTMTPRSPKVVFESDSDAGQAAIAKAISARANGSRRDRRKRKPRLHTSSGWRGWSNKGDLQPRPLGSVAVTDGQVEDIVADIRTFLSMEGEYERRGIPFHRGYLIYGPPGTGKTSAVKAIATELAMDLYAVNLGSVGEDSQLSELVEGVRAGSIMLLEDIDAFGAARERDEGDGAAKTGMNSGVSISGLLNALDGVDTPHGLITIMTTNHKEFLDDALLRPGRVDKHVFFGNPDDATVERHFTYFYDRPPAVQLRASGRSGAEVNEVLVSHMFDPEGAERVLSAHALEIAA